MSNFVPSFGLAKKFSITEEERHFDIIVAKAKAVFDEAVERNLIKRRSLVEVYLDPKDPQDGSACLKIFLQGEPNCSPEAVALPRISLEFDFEAMRAFGARCGIDERQIYGSYDPIAEFYEIILEKNLFEEWKSFRKTAYSLLFDEWVDLCTKDIKCMTTDFKNA